MVPEHKITVEEVKYTMSAYFQHTEYDPYGQYGDDSHRGEFRPMGINRNSVLSLTQIRPYADREIQCLQWIALGSCAFNAFVPFYTNVETIPEYFSNTDDRVSTDNFYWTNRLIAGLADAHFHECANFVEQYQNAVHYKAHEHIHAFDAKFAEGKHKDVHRLLEEANSQMAEFTKGETDGLLSKVLFTASMEMKNKFKRSDA